LVTSLPLISCSAPNASEENKDQIFQAKTFAGTCSSESDGCETNEPEDESPVQRPKNHPGQSPFQGDAYLPNDLDGIRTIDGVGNNPRYPYFGSSHIPLIRTIAPAYQNGA